jgi:cell division protein FtsL
MPFEVVFEKRLNNANVYRDVDVTQRKQYFLLTFLASLFVLGLLFYGWQQYRWIQLGYQIEEAKEKKSDLLEYQKQLVLELGSQARDERIDLIARRELGMVVAAPGQIVTTQPSDPSRVPPSADAAAAPLSAAKR